ncbi:MAG: HEPN domain-containing protein [Thermaerobacter sp.]|nr:HEPN domain-containing protein [Thermaerobacter sp.]
MRWVGQAAMDLEVATKLAETHPNVGCFMAQQAAEKAMQGVLLALGEKPARTHSVVDRYDRLPQLQGLPGERDDFLLLDLYYIPTRYPDALPGAIPARHFSAGQARQAARLAEQAVGACAQALERMREPLTAGSPPGGETTEISGPG